MLLLKALAAVCHSSTACASAANLPQHDRSAELPAPQHGSGGSASTGGANGGYALAPPGPKDEEPLELPDGCQQITFGKFMEVGGGADLGTTLRRPVCLSLPFIGVIPAL